MDFLFASTFPETHLHYPDSINSKDSLQLPQILPVLDMYQMGSDHPPQHASDPDLLEIADDSLWLPEQHDLAGRYDLLAPVSVEMAPGKGTTADAVGLPDVDDLCNASCATVCDNHSHHHSSPPKAARREAITGQSSSNDSTLPQPKSRCSSQSPIRPRRMRKACSEDSTRSPKRGKIKSTSTQHGAPALRPPALHQEQVLVLLEGISLAYQRERFDLHWDERIASWTSETNTAIETRWMLEEHHDAVLVRVRGDAVGQMELVWDDQEQCFIGGTEEGKGITVSHEVMLAMHDDPLGRFVGTYWSYE